MTWWMLIIMIVSGYVVGWFTTAIAITQIGTVKRGCAVGCTHQRNHSWDSYYSSAENERRYGPRFLGAHMIECNKPHFELVRADEAAGYALAWPYLWFFGVLAASELNARKRYEKQQKLKARKENPLTKEKLAEIDRVLEDTNMVVSDDGRIVHLKELES